MTASLAGAAALLCSAATLRAADIALSQWVHEQWQTDRGLPQSSVYCLAQDADGFLWFGTEGGLVRFDGAEFRVFYQRNPPALHNEFVSSLLITRDRAVWAGTKNGGIVRYQNETFDEPFPELRDEGILSLAEGPDGTIWIGTSHGLAKVTGGTLARIDVRNVFSKPRVTAICPAQDGTVWLGSDTGEIAHLSGAQLERVRNPAATRNNSVTAIIEDIKKGVLWIASDGEGLWSLKEGRFTRAELSGREAEYVRTLMLDKDGSLWCGTEQRGIIRYDGGRASMFGAQDGLNTDSVLCLFRDRENSVWAGTLFGGLHRLNRGAFATFGRREGLSSDNITCVLEKKPGVLWLGTKDGGLLRKRRNGTFEPIATPGLGREIRAILRTTSREVWVGGKEGGILRYRPDGSTAPLTTANGLVANDVTAMFQSSDGAVWVGSQKSGLSVVNPETGRAARVYSDGIVQYYVRCITQDSAGTVWIGTQNGLVRVTPEGSLERLDLGIFSDAAIRTILPDGPGTLWLGTRDDGLLHFENGRIFHFEPQHGLSQSRIYQFVLAEDNLWIAGNRGVETARLSELQAVASRRENRVNARLYTERDGLRTSEIGSDASPSAAVDADGTIWFGTRRGLACTLLETEPVHVPPPKVVIESVRLDNITVSTRGFDRVPPGTARLQFIYTAPALVNHARVQFCYKLEGIDKDWVEAGREHEAVYNPLPPGRYTFHVSASDLVGRWSEQPASIAFTVPPRFYQTAWFYALMVLFGSGSMRGLYRWRVAGIQKRNHRLEELVQRRTRELEEEVAQRKRAEQDQISLNAALETRVRARTAELSEAYVHLQGELRERERVEEELAASEARFRRVVESGMVGILFWNHDGQVIDANDTFLRMSGYSREELAAGEIFWNRITPPEHAHKDAFALEEISRTGVCTPFEKEYICKEGRRVPVLVGGASLHTGPNEGVCFVLDISERIASEEKVRQLAFSLEARVQERTRELARINQQLAGEVHERKRVAVALSAFSQLGQKLHGSRTEADAANVIAHTAKSLIPHDICTIELYGNDNLLYPVITGASQDTSEPIRSSISVSIRNGTRVIGVIGLRSTALDAFLPSDASTLQALGDYCGGALDRIHAEEARRETERRFTAFMANAPALAWMKDSEFRYVFTNRMFEEFTGLAGPQIEGKTDQQLWPETIAARIRANDEQVLERDSTIETQETFRRASEENRILLTFRFPFTTASGERFIAGMAIDITAQKHAEEALHRLPQAILEAQEQERRRLARELHDGVNQAIASAKFRILTAENQILRGDHKWQESCSKSKEMLDSVLQQVRRLSHNLRPGELDDLGLLAAARTAFAEFEDRTGIQVHFSVTGAEKRFDPAVESTFYRVIQEALTNIERHSRASAVDIHLTQNISGVILEISDNGIGFDPASATSSARPGLGLLHMRERANLVGAAFSLESAPAQGVRIVIHVPREEKQ